MHFSDSQGFTRSLMPTDPTKIRDWVIAEGVEWFGNLKADNRIGIELTVSSETELWVVPGGAGQIYETPVWRNSQLCGMLHVQMDVEHGTLSFSVDLS
jgi:hypothetical protein